MYLNSEGFQKIFVSQHIGASRFPVSTKHIPKSNVLEEFPKAFVHDKHI